ncbi:methylglyoxal reductase (NADPH-dependent) gre2 [Tulasnella sp. 408]|nr:methylglyoxal reductase (NADPH-dependent) gre2 [Tulasnella sp. 408]
MPAVLPPAKVLVTGASGFIGAWVAKVLLERGFTVIGTDPKGEYLKALFQQHENRFSYVIVPDVGKNGAFDEAVVGIDAVVHVASPVSLPAGDPQGEAKRLWSNSQSVTPTSSEIIEPAVNGTLSILDGVKTHGTSVRRIVITSSKASIMNDKPQTGWPTFDEVCLL